MDIFEEVKHHSFVFEKNIFHYFLDLFIILDLLMVISYAISLIQFVHILVDVHG